MSKELKELKIKKSFEQMIDLVVKMKKVFVKGQSQDIFWFVQRILTAEADNE